MMVHWIRELKPGKQSEPLFAFDLTNRNKAIEPIRMLPSVTSDSGLQQNAIMKKISEPQIKKFLLD